MDTKPRGVKLPGEAQTGGDLGIGKGIPRYFMPLINRNKEYDKIELKQSIKKGATPSKSEFSEYAAKFNLEVFEFMDKEVEEIKAHQKQAGEMESSLAMDVTALDRYNDEIKRYRKVIIDEGRHLPPTVDEDSKDILAPIEDALCKLSRNTYYGTAKAQKLAEGAIPLVIWLANKRFFPESFTRIAIKSLSEMCWNSAALKHKFAKHHGATVFYHNMLKSATNKRLACWATYGLAMIGTGAAEVIHLARKIHGMEEVINELSFDYYWYDWPVNFGMVLQGILYGPNSVTSNEELFQFQ